MSFSLLLDVSEQTTSVVRYSALAVIVIAVAIVLILSLTTKILKTRELVYAGVCISLGTVLSLIKIPLGSFGGSVTLLSMVPMLIYAYRFGFVRGLIAGIVYGVLQFIIEPYILTPLTFALDYVFPFACVCLAGVAKNVKNPLLSAVLGGLAYFAARYAFHVLSGLVYFDYGYVVDTFPVGNAFIYSLCYNAVYLVPDTILALIAFSAVCASTKKFELLFGRKK